MFHWTYLLGKLSVLIFEHPMSLYTCQSPTGNPSSHPKMSDCVTDTTFVSFHCVKGCWEIWGSWNRLTPAGHVWLLDVLLCHSCMRNVPMLSIPVVPKESRMCWAQLFSWLPVGDWIRAASPGEVFFAGCWQYSGAAGGSKLKVWEAPG